MAAANQSPVDHKRGVCSASVGNYKPSHHSYQFGSHGNPHRQLRDPFVSPDGHPLWWRPRENYPKCIPSILLRPIIKTIAKLPKTPQQQFRQGFVADKQSFLQIHGIPRIYGRGRGSSSSSLGTSLLRQLTRKKNQKKLTTALVNRATRGISGKKHHRHRHGHRRHSKSSAVPPPLRGTTTSPPVRAIEKVASAATPTRLHRCRHHRRRRAQYQKLLTHDMLTGH